MDGLVLGAGGLVGVAAALGLLALRSALARRSELLQERMERAVTGTGSAMATASGTMAVAVHDGPGGAASFWAKLLSPLSKLSTPKEHSEDLSRVKRQFAYAGIRNPRAVELYFGTKLGLALLLSAAVVVLNALRATPLPRYQFLAVVAAAAGYYGPSVWLRSRVTKRQLLLSRSLPDALDLLVTCVEAGLGLEAALLRITQDIGLSAPELAAELRFTTAEMQAGVRRAEAFRRLAERTGLEELRNLSAMLIQTEMFGTSIAQALRVHSNSMRVRRTHHAEEKAATVAVKMLLPLILFILPSLFAVILGPAVVRIANVLIPALGNK